MFLGGHKGIRPQPDRPQEANARPYPSGKVAVVTGPADVIGSATIRLLSERGARRRRRSQA